MILPAATASPIAKKKRVLLVDTSRTKRDLRSETMRKLGMDVDCAGDVAEDEAKRAQARLQKVTESQVEKVDALAARKEAEVMEV